MPIPLLAASLIGSGGGGAGAGFLGSIGNFLGSETFGNILGGIGGLFGGGGGPVASQGNIDRSRQDIFRLAGMQGPIGFNTPFGMTGRQGFQPNALFQSQAGSLGGISPLLLQGGLFGDPGFQQALQGNDLAGALGQANTALGQQMGAGTAGLQPIGQGLGGLAGLFGGALPGLLQSGLANQQAAGNQQALFDQSLAAQRAAAQPEQTRMFNQLQDRLFATGRLGSTGGAENLRALFEAQGAQDLGFQNNAFQQALAQQQFLGQLGGQQLGQFGQLGQQAGGFLGQQAGLIGQGFGQTLQALQQNQAAGLQRLQAAQGLFGQGADVFASQFGLGLGAQDALLGLGNLGLQTGMAPWQLQADLLQGSGAHAGALADLGTAPVSSGGGFLGGLFSDRRLKENIIRLGTKKGLNWYRWEWNEKAKAIGADKQATTGVMADEVEEIMPQAVQVDATGYKRVNYNLLFGV